MLETEISTIALRDCISNLSEVVAKDQDRFYENYFSTGFKIGYKKTKDGFVLNSSGFSNRVAFKFGEGARMASVFAEKVQRENGRLRWGEAEILGGMIGLIMAAAEFGLASKQFEGKSVEHRTKVIEGVQKIKTLLNELPSSAKFNIAGKCLKERLEKVAAEAEQAENKKLILEVAAVLGK